MTDYRDKSVLFFKQQRFCVFFTYGFLVLCIIVFSIAFLIVKANNPPRLNSDATIGFTSDLWNANKYVKSGISICEGDYTWTDGDYVEFEPIQLEDTGEELTITVNYYSVYGGSQTIIIDNNGEKIYEGVVTEAGSISAPIELSETDELNITIELPDSVQPKDVSDSQDERDIALALTTIDIE